MAFVRRLLVAGVAGLATSVVVTTTGLPVLPVAAAVTDAGPQASLLKPVPGGAAGTRSGVLAPGGSQVGSVTWPAAASDTATLAGSGAVKAGSLPITVQPKQSGKPSASKVSAAGAGERWTVQVADQQTSHRLGLSGVVVKVAPESSGSVAGSKVSLDYRFLGSSQANLGSRLHWVALPGCALSTPQVAACQTQTAVASTNDAERNTVTATVPETSDPAVSNQRSTAAAEAATGASGSGVVLAAVAGSSGPSGDFTATPLKSSGTWASSGGSGEFQWSYDLELPDPGFGDGVAPQVTFGYSSGTVDGQIAGQNDQSSWLGEGWSYGAGFVERTYRACSEDSSLPKANQTGDLCWAGEILTFNLGGRSNAIVKDSTTGTYRLEGDDGSRVEHITGGTNGANGGEYWKVTDLDGTQYFFGRNILPGGSGSNQTNSVNTVPVYGAHSGDPCYSASGFAASRCTQAWRWNLDMVVDTHHNATVYNYAKETNYYGANNAATPVAYDRASYPTNIQYGLVDDGNLFDTSAAAKVVFNSTERCVPDANFTCASNLFTAANAAHWPDTPQDQACASSGSCSTHSPTFWTTKRLSNVQAQYLSGTSYATADTYTLSQSFATNTGDAQMALDKLQRTGNAGTAITLPAVTFQYTNYDNRVSGYNNQPTMLRKRMTQVSTETGQVIRVAYNADNGQSGRAQPKCASGAMPTDPATNTTACMPVKWTPFGYTAPILDYFHKYVVTQITTSATSSIGTVPDRVTVFKYLGTPAWRYDENETVKPANRTYGQWRGYGKVETWTGSDADGWTMNRATYLRGMNGNPVGTKTQSFSVTDSTGASYPDDDQFTGRLLESEDFKGSTTIGGAVTRVSSSIDVPVTVATTATRTRTGLPAQVARVTAISKSTERTETASGTPLLLTSTYTYNNLGQQTTKTQTATGSDTSCELTWYGQNTTAGISTPTRSTLSAQSCPAAGSEPSNVLSDQRSFYDGTTTLGTVGQYGDVTQTLTATNGTNFAKTTSGYDSYGRTTKTTAFSSASDSTGRSTTTAFTPATGGPVTGITVTNAAGQAHTTTIEAAHGGVTKTTDEAGYVTTATYDALGRTTAVWKPGQVQGSNPATTTFSYLVSQTAPSAITTTSLVDPGSGTTSTIKTIQLYNSYGELQQTQFDASGGGAMVSDVAWDAHGWVKSTANGYYKTAAPTTTVFSPSDLSTVNNRTVTTYDLAGRATNTALYNGTTLTSSTTAVYGGDRVTTFPPTGGVATTTISNARDETIELDRWSARPTVSGDTITGGTAERTTYGYDAAGRQISQSTAVGTPQAATWKSTYDLAGRVTSKQDPDAGNSTSSYNDLGEVLSTTDGRGQTVASTYDNLGRLTAQYSGSVTGTKLADFTYDTIKKGLPTSSTRYVSGVAYTTAVTGYDAGGRATGNSVSLTQPGFAASYTTSLTYTSTGQLKTVTQPAAGGVAAETLTYAYDNQGSPITLTSSTGDALVPQMQYDRDGLPVRFMLGGSPAGYLLDTLDAQTRAVTKRTMYLGSTAQDTTTNTYDKAGNITKTSQTQGPAGAATETTCYQYNGLAQLTQAWSATDSCAANPASNNGSTVGGPQSYWLSWTFNAAGSRATQTAHQLSATATPVSASNPLTPKTADNTTTYSYGSNGHTHALTTAATTGATPSTLTQTVDAAGNVTSRNGASGNQTLTYDEYGKTSTITTGKGTTRYITDTAGNPLLDITPGNGTTLYLGGQDITVTNGAVSSVKRYYSMAGRQVAYRVNTGKPIFQCTNTLGTVTTTWNPAAASGQQYSRSYSDPYGNNLAATTGGSALAAPLLPTGRGFLNLPTSADTGLVNTGQRKYDPTIGAFLSVDPLFVNDDPSQWDGYTYASGNPIGFSDPSGTFHPKEDEPGPPPPSSNKPKPTGGSGSGKNGTNPGGGSGKGSGGSGKDNSGGNKGSGNGAACYHHNCDDGLYHGGNAQYSPPPKASCYHRDCSDGLYHGGNVLKPAGSSSRTNTTSKSNMTPCVVSCKAIQPGGGLPSQRGVSSSDQTPVTRPKNGVGPKSGCGLQGYCGFDPRSKKDSDSITWLASRLWDGAQHVTVGFGACVVLCLNISASVGGISGSFGGFGLMEKGPYIGITGNKPTTGISQSLFIGAAYGAGASYSHGYNTSGWTSDWELDVSPGIGIQAGGQATLTYAWLH